MKTALIRAVALTALFSAMPVAAAAIQADFRSEADLPTVNIAGPKVYESISSIGAGYELDGAHLVSNPSNWGGGEVFVDWNPLTNILSLDSQDTWDFQTYSLSISNILFDDAAVITGITFLGGALTTDNLTPLFSFTGNSINISYSIPQGEFNFSNGSAQFQIALSDGTVAPGVPEPASWALMLLGFGAVGFAARRRQAAATAA